VCCNRAPAPTARAWAGEDLLNPCGALNKNGGRMLSMPPGWHNIVSSEAL
jgi:hypothetical protein